MAQEQGLRQKQSHPQRSYVSAHEHSSSSCAHSTPWTLTSSSWTTPLRPTSPSELPSSKPCAPITRNEDNGPLTTTLPPTGYEPNVLDTSDEFEVLPSIIQVSNVDKIYNLGADNEESSNAEIYDEHIRNAFASPQFPQESEAEARLKQTYHSNEAQSILASTGPPVVWPTQKRKSSQELDDDRIWIILDTQKRSNCSRKQNPKS